MRNTKQAATEAGISRATLQEWIRAGRVKAPKLRLQDGKAIRVWSNADMARLRTVKAAIYRKGRGRKKRVQR
jgi:predicted site-specific integrase-resolvase